MGLERRSCRKTDKCDPDRIPSHTPSRVRCSTTGTLGHAPAAEKSTLRPGKRPRAARPASSAPPRVRRDGCPHGILPALDTHEGQATVTQRLHVAELHTVRTLHD